MVQEADAAGGRGKGGDGGGEDAEVNGKKRRNSGIVVPLF